MTTKIRCNHQSITTRSIKLCSMFISSLLKPTCQLESCARHAYIFVSNQLTFTFLKNRNQHQTERATHLWDEGQSCIERAWKYNKEAPRIRNKQGLEICKEIEPQYFWMTDKTEVYFGKYAWLGKIQSFVPDRLSLWQSMIQQGGQREPVFSWAKAGVEQSEW